MGGMKEGISSLWLKYDQAKGRVLTEDTENTELAEKRSSFLCVLCEKYQFDDQRAGGFQESQMNTNYFLVLCLHRDAFRRGGYLPPHPRPSRLGPPKCFFFPRPW